MPWRELLGCEDADAGDALRVLRIPLVGGRHQEEHVGGGDDSTAFGGIGEDGNEALNEEVNGSVDVLTRLIGRGEGGEGLASD